MESARHVSSHWAFKERRTPGHFRPVSSETVSGTAPWRLYIVFVRGVGAGWASRRVGGKGWVRCGGEELGGRGCTTDGQQEGRRTDIQNYHFEPVRPAPSTQLQGFRQHVGMSA